MNFTKGSNRRHFLGVTAAAAGLLVLPGKMLGQQTSGTTPPPLDKKKPDPLSAAQVKEFVIAGHVDLDKVKAMLAETPGLLNAAWDWGGGDFEMAIGGAGHMGRRDIALYLIDQGSRFDIFVATMLGRLDLVKPALAANPNLLHSKGPHGIPLLAHAKKGGDEALAVVAYLESLQSKA